MLTAYFAQTSELNVESVFTAAARTAISAAQRALRWLWSRACLGMLASHDLDERVLSNSL